jgi:hypothetical protein
MFEQFADKQLRQAVAKAAASCEASSEAFEKIPHAVRIALSQSTTANRWGSLSAAAASALGSYVAQSLAAHAFQTSLTSGSVVPSSSLSADALGPKGLGVMTFRDLISRGGGAHRAENP